MMLDAQTTSKRLAVRKVDKFEKNIMKRGAVPETTTKKGKDYPVGPVLLGFFVFVVIGSCKFCQMDRLFRMECHRTYEITASITLVERGFSA